MSRTSTVAAATTLALLAVGLAAAPSLAESDPPGAAAPAPRVSVGANGGLWAPARANAYLWGKRNMVWFDTGVRLVAGAQPLEVRSTRPDYNAGVRTSVVIGDKVTALPAGTQKNLRRLSDLITVRVTTANGRAVLDRSFGTCLGTMAVRTRPDAPATTPYPAEPCAWHPFATGTVQGLQAGWAAPIGWGARFEGGPGTYQVTTTLNPAYANAMGLTQQEATATTTLTVRRRGGKGDAGPAAEHRRPGHAPRGAGSATPGPEPEGATTGDVTTHLPDLRTLPATYLRLNRAGTRLRFSGTVWNAGPAPLVIDAFRDSGGRTMTTYQSFLDADYALTGSQRIGTARWHSRPDQHWDFGGVVRYRLLDADLKPVAESTGLSTCLSPTDLVDYTVPGAEWDPWQSKLLSDCGDKSSMGTRQVLPTGSGDSYVLEGRGQTLPVADLPAGWYWLSVEANPDGILSETSTDNNVTMRRIRLTGSGAGRTLQVPRVGIIPEPTHDGVRGH